MSRPVVHAREPARDRARPGSGSHSTTSGPATRRCRTCASVEFDAIKLDRSFIGRAPTPTGDAIVAAVASIGTATGARVIAEGIETAEHHERALALGCGFGQGWHFGRPVPAADFDALCSLRLRVVDQARARRARATASSRELTSSLR